MIAFFMGLGLFIFLSNLCLFILTFLMHLISKRNESFREKLKELNSDIIYYNTENIQTTSVIFMILSICLMISTGFSMFFI